MLCRVADSLYWMSRYTERAENVARLLDVSFQLMLDVDHSGDESHAAHWLPVINTLEERELFRELHPEPAPAAVIDFVAFEPRNPNSIHSCIVRARENARTVREQISTEMWEQLNRLYLFMEDGNLRDSYRGGAFEFLTRVVRDSQLFQGVTDATMTHGEGWDFIQAGKSLERADSTSRILDLKYHILLPRGERVGGNVDSIQWLAVLKSCSASEAFLKVHRSEIAPWRVAEFLILHDRFPRSIRFNVAALDAALHRISGTPHSHYANEAERLSGRLASDLDFSSVADIFGEGLHEFLDRIQLRLISVDVAMHRAYFDWAGRSEFPQEAAGAAPAAAS